ncbi:DUF7351 domain-containing protein [Halovenus salina]|uniref:Helix-turn-helix domain-containing protein n=1 Tax=Halovenus salina TaxID=1510225 RepID=A0ABD5VYR3_9EURY|nr:hypothetical protein [Halovenus salina]
MDDAEENKAVGRGSTGPPVTQLSLAPFKLVTEETRATILGTLASYQAENPHDSGIGFNELREAAGIGDSGKFNYHLDKLQPAYVKQTESGYALTNAGVSLVGTLRAGVGAETVRGPETLDAACSICDTELTVRYEDAILSVSCENDHSDPRDYLPPRAVDGRTLQEAVSLQKRRTMHDCEFIREGVCPACFDDVECKYTVLDAPQASHVLVATCEGCGRVSGSPLGMYLLREPPVVAFYHDHGVDVTETPLWTLDLVIAEPTLRSEDPLQLSLSVERDGEQLTLVVDEAHNCSTVSVLGSTDIPGCTPRSPRQSVSNCSQCLRGRGLSLTTR